MNTLVYEPKTVDSTIELIIKLLRAKNRPLMDIEIGRYLKSRGHKFYADVLDSMAEGGVLIRWKLRDDPSGLRYMYAYPGR